jgi:hypothetical protein
LNRERFPKLGSKQLYATQSEFLTQIFTQAKIPDLVICVEPDKLQRLNRYR